MNQLEKTKAELVVAKAELDKLFKQEDWVSLYEHSRLVQKLCFRIYIMTDTGDVD